jgi:hypothetical protein
MLTTFLILAVGFAPQDWYTFAPEGKTFRIDMPKQPNKTSGRSITTNGRKTQLTLAQLTTDNALYLFEVSENSGKIDPKTLDDGLRRTAADNKATIGPIKPIVVNGNPGRECEMIDRGAGGQVKSKVRWVAAGNTLFMITAAGKPGADLPADADRFLGSLKIGVAPDVAGGRPKTEAAGDTVTSAKPPFTIQLPAKAQTLNQSLPGPKGATKQTNYFCKVDGGLYNAQVIAEPESVPQGGEKAAIERSKADYLRSAGVAPTDESRLETNGFPGVEFTTKAPGPDGKKMVESRVRIYVMDGQFVILTAMSPQDAPLPASADAFFKSFRPGSQPPAPSGVATKDEAKPKAATKAAERKTVAPAKITTTRIPKNAKSYPEEDLQDLTRTFLGKDRDGFRDVGPAGSVLVGVRVSYIEKFGGPKIGSVQPIFRSGKNLYEGRIHGDVRGPVLAFVAKADYAVGGLSMHTGLGVDGFRIIYMKTDGEHLDPNDSYNSPWIGDEKGGGPGEVMSKGNMIVGLQGRSEADINALGLTGLK